MSNLTKKTIAFALTLAVMLTLAGALRSNRWFAGQGPRDGYLMDRSEASMGLLSYEERHDGIRSEVSIDRLAAILRKPERAAGWTSTDTISDTKFLALAGKVLFVVAALSIFALGFCLVSAAKPNAVANRVSPRGLAILLLLANILLTPAVLTHIVLGMKPTSMIFVFWGASFVGIMAVDMVSKAFNRTTVEASLPLAYAIA